MVINTPAARSMDWAAGFQRNDFRVLTGFQPRQRNVVGVFLCLCVLKINWLETIFKKLEK